MGALFYGNLEDVRTTEQDWYDNEEFEEMNIDLKQFEVLINVSNKELLHNASKVFFSFFEKNESTSTIQSIGSVTNHFLNGQIYKVSDQVVWFRLCSLERLPSRSFTSRLLEKLCTELFSKYLNNSQAIYLLSRQPSYDHTLEYYTNQQTDDLKVYQQSLPVMFTRASEGLLFEYCIKKQKNPIHFLKLPMLLDEVQELRQFLPAQLYDQIKIKNNYLFTSTNLYA